MSIFNSIIPSGLASVIGGLVSGQRWGLYRNGLPVVVAEQVAAFGYKQDWPISTYPVEDGGFASYDKVAMPYDVRIQFVSGGDSLTRQALLASLNAIKRDLNLYDAVTPDAVYLSCNVQHVDYDQVSDRGVGLIRVNVYLIEIRVTAGAQYNQASPLSNARSPSSVDPVNGGTAQTLTPNQRVQQGFSSFGGAGT